MNLSRRHALGLVAAVSVTGAACPAAAMAATLRPGLPPSAIRLECGPSGRAFLRADGLREQIVLPGLDAGVAAIIPLAGREIVLVSFGVAIPLGWLDLVAFIGWDNTVLRVLGLELARYRGIDGASVDTRISAVSDGARVRLARESFTPRPPPLRSAFHEGWIDYLRWQDGLPLADAPVRPVLPGTHQAKLAHSRARMVAALSAPSGSRMHLTERSLYDAAGLLDPLGDDPVGDDPVGDDPREVTMPNIPASTADQSPSARLATLAR